MTPVRRAALRLEMAEGRVQALACIGEPDLAKSEEATLVLEMERISFRNELERATGCNAETIRRALAL